MPEVDHAPAAPRAQIVTRAPLWLLLASAVALLLRLRLGIFIPGYPVDINIFMTWTIQAVKEGLPSLYSSETYCDYPPLFLLVLKAIGETARALNMSPKDLYILIKLPGMLADLLLAWLAYALLRRRLPRAALGGALLLLFHPVLIFVSALWGQIDSITALLLLLSTWLMIRKRYAAALICLACNGLIKPQGLLLLPLALTLILADRRWRELALGTLSSLGLATLVTWPFTGSPVTALPHLLGKYLYQAGLYPLASIWAFNLWGIVSMWEEDLQSITGNWQIAPWYLQQRSLGLLLFALALAAVLGALWQALPTATPERREHLIWWAATLILLAFFMLPTRMHERYLFSGFCFVLLLAIQEPRMRWPAALLSLSFLCNLLYTFPGRELIFEAPEWLGRLNIALIHFNFWQKESGGKELFGLLHLGLFLALLWIYVRRCRASEPAASAL